MSQLKSYRARPLALAFLLLVTLRPALAQWASLGNMPAPRRAGDSLLFRNAQGSVAMTVVTDDIVRVRFAPIQAFGRDHSYAVMDPKPEEARATFTVGKERSEIATRSLKITIRQRPFRIAFADAAGASLDEDDPAKGIAVSGSTVRVWKRLQDDEHVYGFGEKTGGLDKRGNKLGGASLAMWNSDTFAYGMSTDPLYASVPFFLVLRAGAVHGIFLDNTFRTSFDVGHESQGLLSFGADGGELNYYFIQGPEPKKVIERYTALTGRMPLPPLWALGYHQCRYSYFPESKVRFIAESFRQRHIPADVLWLDIHYQDGYKPFTWDRERFPNPPRLLADLENQGFKVVTIVDPHPKKEPGYAPYDSGLAGDHFVKRPDGKVFEADAWPSQAEKNPGPSVFPDFSRAATRDWWGALYKPLLDAGVDGIWNDMNEPALFVQPAGTMPLDVRHDNEGQPTDHREIHNVYGLLMSRSTWEGLHRLRPDERPFVLTRATYAGGQRWAAQWPGDNVSTWEHLQGSIPMLLGMGLSGLPFVGVDIGGFAGAPTPELYTRWLQAGVFFPFMRTHTAFGTPDQEPWSFGTRHEDINRRAIEQRYEFLPEIYNVMKEAADTGLPALRPLVLEYPLDSNVYGLDDEVLFGSDLLVAPVLSEGALARGVYLPAGDWYDFWTGKKQKGGDWTDVPVTLERIPIFVRAGSFVFRQPVVQNTGEMPGQPLKVSVYPADRSERWLYEDDGRTLAYQRGVYLKRRFSQTREGQTATIDIGPPDGTYRPAARSLILQIRWDGEPKQVTRGSSPVSSPLARHTLAELDKETEGWAIDPDGWIVVKQPDRFEPARLTIE